MKIEQKWLPNFLNFHFLNGIKFLGGIYTGI